MTPTQGEKTKTKVFFQRAWGLFYRMLKCMCLQTAVETRKSSHVMTAMRFSTKTKILIFWTHLWGRGRDMLPTLTWTWICQQITTVHLNMYKGRTNWGCLVEFDLVLLTRVEYTWIGLDMLSSVLLPIGLSGEMGIINQESKLFSSFH